MTKYLRTPNDESESRSKDISETDLCRQAGQVNKEELITKMYQDLKAAAHELLRQESKRRGKVLLTSDLLQETMIRLLEWKSFTPTDRKQLFSLAARIMRNVLVDQARSTPKGTLVSISLAENLPDSGGFNPDLLVLDQALTRLGEKNSRQLTVVEMRYFAGLTIGEIAEVLNLSARTIAKDWKIARTWLFRELKHGEKKIAQKQ